MSRRGLHVGDLVLDGRYEILVDVHAPTTDRPIYLGRKGACRYCGIIDRRRFRSRAHTFPKALGNKWVVSLDECDACNALFSRYDDAIANSAAPFLTLGGIEGKGNTVRQTGLDSGHAVLSYHEGASGRGLVMRSDADPEDNIAYDPLTDTLLLRMPIAPVPFRPRHAYKALVKMAFALLPEEELRNYRKLRAWLLIVDDEFEFPNLEVALSFGSIANAPPLVAGTLLRRVDPTDIVPHIAFILTAGSICFQIHLMSDRLEDHLHYIPPRLMMIDWGVTLGDPDSDREVHILYSRPIHRNWSSRDTAAQPMDALAIDFCLSTGHGNMTPKFRAT